MFRLDDIIVDLATDIVTYVPVVFRASGISILFLWGWAVNVQGFESYHIPFRKALSLKKSESQADQINEAVRTLLGVLVVCCVAHQVCGALQQPTGQLVTLIMFWVVLFGLIIFSKHSYFKEMRLFLQSRFSALINCQVHFVDVLTADALTSMSKLLADMQSIVCAMVAIFSKYPETMKTSCLHSIVGPVLASVPYAVRGFQCLVVYKQTGNRLQLINFGKYMSSFPVIWTSVLQHQLAPAEGAVLDQHDRYLQLLWLYAVTLNTLYSFLWDVLMDWGLAMSSRPRYPLLRDDLLYGNPLFYYCAIIMDLALRLCWSLKLSSHLQRHATGQAFVFLFEILEVFRRFVWNFFRVEWECVKEKYTPDDAARESREKVDVDFTA